MAVAGAHSHPAACMTTVPSVYKDGHYADNLEVRSMQMKPKHFILSAMLLLSSENSMYKLLDNKCSYIKKALCHCLIKLTYLEANRRRRALTFLDVSVLQP